MFSRFFQRSIQGFIVFWGSLAIGACLVLAGVLLYTTNRLESQTGHLILSARVDDSALLLRNEILAERRADLVVHLTGDSTFVASRRQALETAARIIGEMDVAATTPAEENLIDQIEEKFRDFRSVVSDSSISLSAITPVTNNLLAAIDQFRDANNARTAAIIAGHESLLVLMHRWLVLLIVLVAAAVAAGSYAVARRIARPAVELNYVAGRFRQGDFNVRARIFYNDELGALTRTFNDMAEEIGRREQSRHEFLASVFHDIRNPLVNLGGIARLLIRKPLPPETVRHWLERALREVDRIEDLAQDLTDTVQVETGNFTLSMAEVDLVQLVEQVHAEHVENITRHRIVYEHSGTCLVLGDARRLERVVANLISNAVKYSPVETTITLRVECVKGRAVFSVTDEGVGISPEEVQTVFQPFGRLSRTKGMAHGTGLGLSIVKRIIEAHGGEVRLISSLNMGTTVEISLPSV